MFNEFFIFLRVKKRLLHLKIYFFEKIKNFIFVVIIKRIRTRVWLFVLSSCSFEQTNKIFSENP